MAALVGGGGPVREVDLRRGAGRDLRDDGFRDEVEDAGGVEVGEERSVEGALVGAAGWGRRSVA